MLLCSLLINLSTIPIVGYFIYKKYKQVTSVSAADQRRENRIDMFNRFDIFESEIGNKLNLLRKKIKNYYEMDIFKIK